MTPKFICDECFVPFVIHIKVSRKKTRRGVQEQWLFSCPFCGLMTTVIRLRSMRGHVRR